MEKKVCTYLSVMMKEDPGLEHFDEFQISTEDTSCSYKTISKTVLLNFDHHGGPIFHETPAGHLVIWYQELNLHIQEIFRVRRK
jgi:hypothetical protein